jgi:PPM family protein phosphatase
LAILCSGDTHVGMKRTTNQDSISLNPELNLFIVADGMGGHNGGDIASQLTIEHLPQLFKENLDKDPKELLKLCVKEVNRMIYDKGQSDPQLKGMGTTIVSKFFKGPNIYVANVGDSRSYLVNNGKLFQLTRDHSFVQEKINMAIYTREQAKFDKQKNIITRTVGFDPEVEVDVYTYKICKNDIFFICSDGLSGYLSDPDILFLINKYIPEPAKATQEDLDQTVQVLIEKANANGGKDNISVIISVAK